MLVLIHLYKIKRKWYYGKRRYTSTR
jgi:hypothetical protein